MASIMTDGQHPHNIHMPAHENVWSMFFGHLRPFEAYKTRREYLQLLVRCDHLLLQQGFDQYV